MSVPNTTSIASIFICVAKVAVVELVRDVPLHEVLLLAHDAAPEAGQHSRRATPRWKRTDLPLPLSVSGQAGGAAAGAGRRGQPPGGAGGRWEGRISSGVELCNQRVLVCSLK